MGRTVGVNESDPAFVVDLPEFREIGGMVLICRNGETRAVMQMSSFERYIRSGQRLIREFHTKADGMQPITFVPRRDTA